MSNNDYLAVVFSIADDSAYILETQNSAEIALSHTVSEINKFLCFMQKFKMATKDGGRTSF